jgi:hypothetical protein
MMRALTIFAAGAVGTVAVVLLIGGSTRDDSDPPNGRSGLVIYKDHLTGCEYLARPAIAPLMAQLITPRMDADGRQVCRKN